jgi:alanyl-tRNA synthetase
MGAMALFGEKYGEMVRVVVMDENYSVELCGGTHVGSTGELGFFKIISESAVAAGVRRIEAVCGAAAEQYVDEQLFLLNTVKESLKNVKDPVQAVIHLQDELSQVKKKAEQFENQVLAQLSKELISAKEIINGISFVGTTVEVSSADALKKIAFDMSQQLSDGFIVLTSSIQGKASVAIALAENLAQSKNWDASKMIKEKVAPLIKGGGGGQKTLATAGGQDAGQFDKIIRDIRQMIELG